MENQMLTALWTHIHHVRSEILSQIQKVQLEINMTSCIFREQSRLLVYSDVRRFFREQDITQTQCFECYGLSICTSNMRHALKCASYFLFHEKPEEVAMFREVPLEDVALGKFTLYGLLGICYAHQINLSMLSPVSMLGIKQLILDSSESNTYRMSF